MTCFGQLINILHTEALKTYISPHYQGLVRDEEFVFNGDRVSVCDDENILEVEGGDGCPTART